MLVTAGGAVAVAEGVPAGVLVWCGAVEAVADGVARAVPVADGLGTAAVGVLVRELADGVIGMGRTDGAAVGGDVGVSEGRASDGRRVGVARGRLREGGDVGVGDGSLVGVSVGEAVADGVSVGEGDAVEEGVMTSVGDGRRVAGASVPMAPGAMPLAAVRSCPYMRMPAIPRQYREEMPRNRTITTARVAVGCRQNSRNHSAMPLKAERASRRGWGFPRGCAGTAHR
jgi:hypothetical protein